MESMGVTSRELCLFSFLGFSLCDRVMTTSRSTVHRNRGKCHRPLRIRPLAIAQEPPPCAGKEAQKGIDRRQAADPTPVLVPGHVAIKRLGIPGLDRLQHLSICIGNLAKLARRDLVRIAKLRSDVRQVGAGHDQSAPPQGHYRIPKRSDERVDLPIFLGRAALLHKPVKRSAQDWHDSHRVTGWGVVAEENRLEFDGVFSSVGHLVIEIAVSRPPQEVIHEFLVRFDRS